MTKTEAELLGLFLPHLYESEEIIWLGSNELFMIPEIRMKKGSKYFIWFLIIVLSIVISVTGFAVGFPYATIILLFVPMLLVESDKAVFLYVNQLSLDAFYSITNERILVSRQGQLHSYPLMPITEIILGKAREGQSKISFYYTSRNRYPLPKPAFQLTGIPEEEAQSVYAILRQAREEALENRAREMGIG